jgi:hypothetical protein
LSADQSSAIVDPASLHEYPPRLGAVNVRFCDESVEAYGSGRPGGKEGDRYSWLS